MQTNIYTFDFLPSTNAKLKSLKSETDLEEYSIVITNKQTEGKGQGGNSWESEAGKNLTFSLYIKPNYIQIQDQFLISKAVALGIIDFLNEFADGFTIKWPNDIYWRNKKIAGILIENAICQNLLSESIIGIGLNVNQETFISDAPNPISLKNITNKEFDLTQSLHQLVGKIIDQLSLLKHSKEKQISQSYLNKLYRNKGFFKYKEGEEIFEAEITGINAYGHLELKTKDGHLRSYAFKEVDFMIDNDN